VIVIVSRLAISYAVATFGFETPITWLFHPSGLMPLASGLHQTQRARFQREARGLGHESLDLCSRTRAKPKAITAANRLRRCWLGGAEKDRFNVAYSTGFRKNEQRQSQPTWVMYAVGEKMGANASNINANLKCLPAQGTSTVFSPHFSQAQQGVRACMMVSNCIVSRCR